jgi:hypothetical protein
MRVIEARVHLWRKAASSFDHFVGVSTAFGVWYGRAKNSAVNNAVDKNAINSRRPI